LLRAIPEAIGRYDVVSQAGAKILRFPADRALRYIPCVSANDSMTDWPYLTADLPGVGGEIKRFDDDFVVEEAPLYLPSGQGTHTYFTIEKRGLTTHAVIQHIARLLGRQPYDIGYAGLKDAHGVTRQTFSIEHVDPNRVSALELGRAKVLSVDRHTNKLKLGHLAGNRFAIKIRDTGSEPETAARAVLDVLTRRGLPNYFGPQRFGVRGDNAQIGLAVLRENYDEAFALMLGRPGPVDHGAARKAQEFFDAGDFEAAAQSWPRGVFSQQSRLCRALLKTGGDTRKAWRTVDHTMRKLYISAFQSGLFNRVLAQRIASIDRLETGDIAWKHVNGACFRVEDAATEQPRCDALEISPTGPLFGRRMTEAAGTPGQMEAAVLAECGLHKEQIATPGSGKTSGARRPLRVPIGEPTLETGADDNGPYLLLRFFLPPGAYATNVVREISKNPGDAVDF